MASLISVNLNLPNSSTATANGVPTVIAQNPFAGNGSAGLPAATPFGAVTWYYDPKIKNPYSIQYNLGLQRQLNPSTTVSGNYVGAQNHRLNVGGFYNTALTPGPGDPKSRALFPYIEPTFYDRSIGAGNYNAFQFQLNKRLPVDWLTRSRTRSRSRWTCRRAGSASKEFASKTLTTPGTAMAPQDLT